MSADVITLILNGSPYQTAAPLTLADLLDRLELAGRPVVVELDEAAVFPRDYAQTPVLAGARVEVVALAAGG